MPQARGDKTKPLTPLKVLSADPEGVLVLARVILGLSFSAGALTITSHLPSQRTMTLVIPVATNHARNGMQLLQDTTNAHSQLPDNQSVCALRALEVTHWKFIPHLLSGKLIKRTHSALLHFSLQQASLAFVPF